MRRYVSKFSKLFQLRIKGHDNQKLRQHKEKKKKTKNLSHNQYYHLKQSEKPGKFEIKCLFKGSLAVGSLEVGKKIYGKQSGDVHLELLTKHRRVSKDEDDSTYSMVEADD